MLTKLGCPQSLFKALDDESSGVEQNPTFKPWELGKLIFVPLAVEKTASVGQWSISITTNGEGESSFVELVEALFEIK